MCFQRTDERGARLIPTCGKSPSGLRVFYRVTKEKSVDLKPLHQFLRKGFKGKSVLEEDLRELKDAMARGACAIPTPIRTVGLVVNDATSGRAPLAAN